MKVSKKLFIMVVLFVAGFVLMACGETTTEATTAAPTTEAPTTVEDTTVAPTTEAPTTEAPTTEAPTTEAPVDLEALIDDLEAHYADTLGNESFVATDDITLLATIGGVEIVWTTSNAALIADDGTVTQPSYTVGNQNAILTATLTDGEDSESTMFFVAVQALAKTDQERADEAFDTVAIFPDKDSWTIVDEDLLVFATTAQDEDEVEYTVVWTSSHPAIIPAAGGEINQPEDANVDVTMTATISINSVDYTTTVVFTVAKLAEGLLVTDLASILLLEDDQGEPAYIDAYVKIPGMTCIGISDDGAYFTDGVNIIFTYSPKFEVEMGGVYDVTGSFIYFYGLYQLEGSDELPLKADPSTAAAVATPITDTLTVAEMYALPSPSDTNPEFAKMYTVTGAIYYDTDMDYATYMVPSDYDFGVARTGDKPNGTEFVEMYYRGDDEVLWAFNEQVITIDLLYGGYHDGHSNIHARFHGDITDVSMTFDTDQEAVDQALAALLFPGEIIEATTLDLLDEVFGVTLSYASDNETLINPTTGVVDLTGLTTQETVTITVTGTKGETATGTRNIEIVVGELAIITVAEAIALGDGATVRVIGIITDTTDTAGYGAYWLQDETGALDLFNKNSVFTEDMIGKTYEFIGEIDVYNGLFELVVSSIDDVTELTGDDALTMPTAVDLSAMTLDETTLLPYQGMLTDLTGFFLESDLEATYTSSFNMYMINAAGEQITVRIDKDVPGFAAFVTLVGGAVANTQIDFTNVIVGWYNGPQILVPSNATITVGTTLTETELLAMDVADLEAGATEYATGMEYQIIELPDTLDWGSAVTWTLVSGTATLSDGVLKLDPTGTEHDVVVEATVSLGTATAVTRQFTMTVSPITIVTDFSTLHANTGGVWTIVDETEIYVMGVVTNIVGTSVYIQDANGVGLNLYSPDGSVEVGDEVIFSGETGSYNGVRQLNDGVLYSVWSTENTLIVNELTLDTVADLTIEDSGTLFSITGLTYTGVSYGKYQLDAVGTSTTTLELYPDEAPEWFLDVFSVGDTLPEITFIYEKYESWGAFNITDMQMEMTDEMKLTVDIANFDIPDNFTEDFVVVVTGMYGTTFTVTGITGDAATGNYLVWNSTTNTVEFTQPATDTTGVITVEAVQGTLPAVPTDYNVVAKAAVVLDPITELFISEYAEGSGSNKYIEIYNGTGADVDLTGYTLELYSNGATTVTQSYTLTGTLTNGDVFILANSSADAIILAASDDDQAYPSVPNWNGDDCVTLSKDGVIIDIILSVGHPKDDKAVAENVTLVRNPDVTGPTTTFDINEWTDLGIDTWTDIGVHTVIETNPITELFISEYAEGSGSNKYIEIYNGTGADVDLTGYTLELYSNGATTVTQSYTLTGTLTNGDVFILANSSADAIILAASDDDQAYPSVPNWNGDDCVTLSKDGVIIDIILSVGHPKDDKAVAENVTLVRNPDVTGPTTTFDINEWTDLGIDTWTDIGVHTVTE
ncbi:lamin tail domain-containing protein [Candidatus Izemoplasma sp. B36]|uniref:lamin tail domain-containing protein n=1 Tax=Candidatus Izemoplasma sp. B36 TaxID=3242468 RepID=UPI0035580BBB